MPVYAVTAVQKTMYVTQPVHVRASYTTKSDVLTSFGTGQKVAVTGQSANGWMRITYKGGEAYIYKKYLSSSKAGERHQGDGIGPSGDNTGSGQKGLEFVRFPEAVCAVRSFGTGREMTIFLLWSRRR